MNVMKKAHEMAKAENIRLLTSYRPAIIIPYRELLSAALKKAHKMNKEQMAAVKHFEDCIAKTLVHFEELGVNDYYIAVENNSQLHDYTLLQHKDVNDKQSPLGWASYSTAIVTHPAQADEYVKAFPGVVKLHAQTHLSRTMEFMQAQIDEIKSK
jgi:hypothetical protein